MMKLSMMRDFLESENHSSFIYSVLEKWGYKQGSVKFIRASSNFVYSFEKDSQKLILRITPEGNITRLKREISILEYLAKHNILINVPISSIAGNKIERIEGHLGKFYSVVFTFLSGIQYELEELNESQYFLWGNALGRLHKFSQRYSSINHGEIENHMIHHLREIDRLLPKKELEAKRELKTLKAWLDTLETTMDNYGFLHLDFELDNLVWQNNHVQILDFESHIDGWYVADIAFALRDLFDSKADLAQPSFQLFLKGYRENMKISEQELENIPMFLRLETLFTFSKLLKTLDINSSSNQPEWVTGLYQKLISKLEECRRSFKSHA